MGSKIVKLLKRKEFYFLIVYPLILKLAGWINDHCATWTLQHANYYGFVVLATSLLIVAVAISEIVVRLYAYNLQGDKLRMRQSEGIEIEEMKDEHR